jgi:hypothetical protein
VKFGLEPKIGEVVTYEFERYSRRELPVNVKIDRVRRDKAWELVVSDYWRDEKQKEQLRRDYIREQRNEFLQYFHGGGGDGEIEGEEQAQRQYQKGVYCE